MSRKYEHIVFDLDGTLIDSELPCLKTWQHTLRRYGYEFTLEEVRKVFGLPTIESLAGLGVTGVDAEEFQQQWFEDYHLVASEATFYPGTEELLRRLKEAGLSIGAATSRTQQEYDAFFPHFHLERFMGLVVVADMTEKHKPEADPLLYYAEQTGASPSECLFIGDMPTDMAAARAAGFGAGLLAWTPDKDRIEADRIFHSCEELQQALLM